MKTLLYILPLFALVLGSCKKSNFSDMTPKGEGLVGFTLKSPGTGTKLSLNAATPNSTINFSWNESKPGLHTLPTYTLVAVRRTNEAANFDTPLIQFDAGANTSLALTTKQIDDALKAKGVADGALSELLWSVKATNGDVTIVAQNQFFIDITRMKDGASPFFLLGPASSTSSVELTPSSTTDLLKFNWTKSNPAMGGAAIKYKVTFTKTDGSPLFSVASNNTGIDTLLSISHKQFNDSLVKYGYADFSVNPVLKWTAAATSGTWTQVSEYINDFSVSRLIKYVYPQALNVAGNFQGWSPATAPQLVAMTSVGGPYSEYAGFIDFGNNTPEFKIVKGNDWNAGDYGMVDATTIGNGSNFSLASGGVYLFKVNTTAMSWSATKIISFGLIGDATGSWEVDKDMTYDAATQKWSITLPLTTGAIKFRANDGWDINLGDDGPDGMLELGAANISIASAGTYTVTLSVNNGGNWRYSVVRN